MRLPGLLAVLAAAAALVSAQPAHANIVLITVDKSAQQMTVSVDGDPRYVWPVSTGRSGYDTPGGQYTPFRMERDHFSREWDDAPMPYSIFFTKQGHAIHGTNHAITGEPASHGCVRLSVNHAAQLWALVKQEGMANVHVELFGRNPSRGELMARRDANRSINDDARNNDPANRANEPTNSGQANSDRIASDEPDVTGDLPQQQAGGWHEYREGGRVYYYRDGPDEERRVYHRRAYHYYRHFGGFPYW